MTILNGAIIIFLILESLNVMTLYFRPESKKGNGLGVFNAWEKSKEIPEVHQLVKYLTNWVAGTKLIFIGLLVVIVMTADFTTKLLAVGVLILSILSFYWRLYPLIKEVDQQGHLSPKGYSKTLGIMIGCFILVFALAFLLALII